ncbi:hypothetical protein SANA_07380 [Gottschalkiaceae bacterium SANA]|nr:hypothetical protein SANA_07380 [Gottschalkiaceae bacterium SANA]
MIRPIEKIYHPVWRQLAGGQAGFEGWYYRLVSADHLHSLALIPGFQRGEKEEGFLQILMQGWERGMWLSYPMEEMAFTDRPFEVRAGKNIFSLKNIHLSVDSPRRIRGQVQIKNARTYPVTLISPGIMGWYRYVPKMECYHAVVMMDAELDGEIQIQGQSIDFTGGRLYVEKDWGASFPSAWIWVQSNQFKQTGTSFMLSLADIPWRNSSFEGFIAYLQTPEKLYRFTTYTGAKIVHWEEDSKAIHLTLEDRKYRLSIRIIRSGGGELRAPQNGSMNRILKETIAGKVDLWLEKRNGERIVSCTGDPAGFEQAGIFKSREVRGGSLSDEETK